MARLQKQLHENSITLYDRSVPEASFASQVVAGLRKTPKQLSPKFFYDKRGSELFEAICSLPEYYLTRADIEILDNRAEDIAELLGKHIQLVEFGSGNSQKVRLLLAALRPEIYMPIDISKEHLIDCSQSLASEFPWLSVHAVCTDYSLPQPLPYRGRDLQCSGFFPGSSIGNFDPAEAKRFLMNVRQQLEPGGFFIVSVDLKKDPAILEAAYNDVQGITAAFNLNLLQRIKYELCSDVRIENFEHRAYYNEAKGRIEMHLLSRCAQTFSIEGETFSLDRNETIHTESSYKYTITDFQNLATASGFKPVTAWTDDAKLFSVHILQVPAA